MLFQGQATREGPTYEGPSKDRPIQHGGVPWQHDSADHGLWNAAATCMGHKIVAVAFAGQASRSAGRVPNSALESR